MEHSKLAMKAIALISPFLIKGAEQFMQESGKDVYWQTINLKNWLWQQFEEATEPRLRQTADLFETDPATFREALIRLLATFLQKNPGVARELSRHIKDLEPQNQTKYSVNIGKVYGMNLGDYGRIDQTFYGRDQATVNQNFYGKDETVQAADSFVDTARLVKLSDLMAYYFNLEDIRNLSFQLGIDFDDLGG